MTLRELLQMASSGDNTLTQLTAERVAQARSELERLERLLARSVDLIVGEWGLSKEGALEWLTDDKEWTP